MANSVTARFNDDCKVFVSMSDDTTVEKAVIIDAEGNETDIGGGGGESDFKVILQTLEIPETVFTGEESGGAYMKSINVGQPTFDYPINFDSHNEYSIFVSDGAKTSTFDNALIIATIDGVEITYTMNNNEMEIIAYSEEAFTVTLPKTTLTFFRASEECAETFETNALIIPK